MKGIASKENDLDQTLDQVEKAEKLILEKDNLTRVAKEEARNLTSEIAFKEQELRRCKEALDATQQTMTSVTSRYPVSLFWKLP